MFHSSRRPSQQMRYPVNNDTYRDIYNQRDLKRGHRKKPISSVAWKAPVLIVTVLIFALVFSFIAMIATTASNSPLNKILKLAPVGFMPSVIALLTLKDSFFSILAYAGSGGLSLFVDTLIYKRWRVQNVPRMTQLVNNHRGDAHIEEPEVLSRKYNVFPDAGAHSGVVVSAALSHQMLTSGMPWHRIKRVRVAKRYSHDVLDSHGQLIHRKGDCIRDDTGEVVTSKKPMFDAKFSRELFDASKIPKDITPWHRLMWGLFPNYYTDPGIRARYNPFKLLYNPDNQFGKQKQYTVGKHINEDWTFPWYERQRPAGMYIVDDKPTNTIIIGKTRSAKGQTVINPTLDMWSRQNTKVNVVANDPKGELYLAFYKPYEMRGYNVMAFNLINESKTSIFNPLGYAWNAAIHGDFHKVEEIIDNLGVIFFPTSNGEDKFWAQASNLVFKRSALELIDYYLDEYYDVHDQAVENNWSPNVFDRRADEIGGHISLRNTYFMMKLSQYTSESREVDPKTSLKDFRSIRHKEKLIDKHKNAYFKAKNENNSKCIKEELDHIKALASEIPKSKPKDYLTLLSNAEEMLPDNAMRDLIANQDGALKSMTQSEKTIASINGISLTEMNFFTDAKVSRLTSGRPSQNFDMASLGFPRRIQVRFDYHYMKNKALDGQRFEWDAYSDKEFKHQYKGSDFTHSGNIDEYGWVPYIFKGIFPKHVAYLRLRIIDQISKHELHSFYFRFMKGYLKSADGRTFVYDPITHKRIIQGGSLREMQKDSNGNFVFKNTTYKRRSVSLVGDESKGVSNFKTFHYKVVNRRAFIQTNVNYTEKPKAIFCITPPNLAKYAKIILIMLDQMFNMQVSMAYMTKKNQKPLYETNYMLDEVGNLRSDGKGIPFLTTKESIGLGQGQHYTLVVQDLQQFKDIYGQNANKTIEGNTSNFIYLNSTDIKMDLELSQLSGATHRTYHDSLGYTQNGMKMGMVGKRFNSSLTTKKENVLTLNDFLLIPPASSYTLGKGNPIASRNQDVMPMAYKLLGKQKANYSLGTIPSINDTSSFNALENQPDIHKLLKRRVYQARLTKLMTDRFKVAHSKKRADGRVTPMTDDEFNHLNPEIRSREIMRNINNQIRYDKRVDVERRKQEQNERANSGQSQDTPLSSSASRDANEAIDKKTKADENKSDEFTENTRLVKDSTVNKVIANINSNKNYNEKPRFANNNISLQDLFDVVKGPSHRINFNNPHHSWDNEIADAYANSIAGFNDDPKFLVGKNNSMYLNDANHTPLIQSLYDDNSYSRGVKKAKEQAKSSSNKHVNNMPGSSSSGSSNDVPVYQPTDSFYVYLGRHTVNGKNSWSDIADGQFDKMMDKAYNEDL